jgi:hypothetical protein
MCRKLGGGRDGPAGREARIRYKAATRPRVPQVVQPRHTRNIKTWQSYREYTDESSVIGSAFEADML